MLLEHARTLILATVAALGLAGCATPPPPKGPIESVATLWHDEAFSSPAQAVRVEDVFAISDEMVQYLDHDINRHLRRNGRQRGLIDALYDREMLRLDYDA